MGKGVQSIPKFPLYSWEKKVSKFLGLEPNSPTPSPLYCQNTF